MNYLEELNDKQLEAVVHVDGPCLVLAGAGSGKTKVLTTRIARLIDIGIPSYNILAITFTNKAAQEMKERLESIVPGNYAFVGTFHALGVRILRENAEVMGYDKNYSIIDSDDALSIIKKIMKEKMISIKEITPSYVRNKISSIKNDMLTDNEIDNYFSSGNDSIIKDIYYEYQSILRNNNSVDFDDLLLLPVKMFMEHKDILESYQDKYKYILVDEYQDTNEVQYKLYRRVFNDQTGEYSYELMEDMN